MEGRESIKRTLIWSADKQWGWELGLHYVVALLCPPVIISFVAVAVHQGTITSSLGDSMIGVLIVCLCVSNCVCECVCLYICVCVRVCADFNGMTVSLVFVLN